MAYDHPSLPLPLKRETERWLFTNKAAERKPGETESQFLYKNRKFAIGPFKEQFWNLPEGTRNAIGGSLEKKFRFLFEKLRRPRNQGDASPATSSRWTSSARPRPRRRPTASCATTRRAIEKTGLGTRDWGLEKNPKEAGPEESRPAPSPEFRVPSPENHDRRGENQGRAGTRSDGDQDSPRPRARPGRGPDPGARDGGLRHRQAHLPVGSFDGRDRPAPADLRPRVLRRDRRVRSRRGPSVPARGTVRLGRDARHLRQLPALPDRPAAHLREHAHPRRPRRRLLRAVRRGPRLQRGAARRRRRPSEGRRVSRRARKRRPHDPDRGPLGQVRRRPGLRPDRRDVRRDRAGLRRVAHRDHRGQRPRDRARPQVGEIARPFQRHGARPRPNQGPRGEPARRDRRRRRRRAGALRGRGVDQPRPRRGPPRSDGLAPGPAARDTRSRSATTPTT